MGGPDVLEAHEARRADTSSERYLEPERLGGVAVRGSVAFEGQGLEDRSHGWTRIYTDGLGAEVIGFEDKMNTDAAAPRACHRPFA